MRLQRRRSLHQGYPLTSITPTYHWVVRTNYQNRTGSFLMLFAILGAQMKAGNYGLPAWGALVLVFIVYPHLACLRARRAVSPYRAELNNLLIDSALFGVCAAALGFPMWISFALLIGTAITHVLYLGIAGVWRCAVAIALGVIAGVAALGLRFVPETELSASILCMVGLTLYLLNLAHIANLRTRKLQDSRQRLHQSELALNHTNTALQSQLAQIQSLQVQLSDQANRDALTGLYNRRYLDAALQRELSRCQQEGSSFGLLLLDIDFFKRVNDTHGHAAGDEVLRRLAATLQRLTRLSDGVCRFGGEEFVVLLPGTGPGAAHEKAEQLRLAFEAESVVYEESTIQTTLSIGIAISPEHGHEPQALVMCADLALYQAKSDGRNRTVLYQPSV